MLLIILDIFSNCQSVLAELFDALHEKAKDDLNALISRLDQTSNEEATIEKKCYETRQQMEQISKHLHEAMKILSTADA